tara:strand:- start:3321 stop:3551 length:231 start_codon:yes stop_codon:yes gene_type:complete
MNLYSINDGKWHVVAGSLREAVSAVERRSLERERELDEFFGDGRSSYRPPRLVINSIREMGEVLIAEPEVTQWPPY